MTETVPVALIFFAGVGCAFSLIGLFKIRRWQRDYQRDIELDRQRRHQFERGMRIQ